MRELRGLLQLTAPILVTNIGSMLLGVVDTAVVGRLGEVELGAVGLGGTVFFTVSVLGFGWMLALDPLISQAVGAKEPGRARALLGQGMWLGLVGALPLALAVVVFSENIRLLGVPDGTARESIPYVYARLAGLVPFLWLAAGRAYLQAHEITRPLIVGVVVANVLNLPLSIVLVFGEPSVGIPALGTAGAGWASAVSTFVQLFVAVIAIRGMPGKVELGRPDRAVISKVLRLGTPIGLGFMAEVGSFAIVTVLMANLGTRALSGHNVALTTISFTFQFPLAIGAAGAVRVGHAVGRGDHPGTQRAGLTAIGVGALTMICFAIVFVAFPGVLSRVFTDEPAVVAAAVPLFLVAAAFQISDGVQAVAAGTLRGAGDTRWPLVVNLFGHYAIGVPVGATLTFYFDWGPVGLWWGLSAGLSAVAIFLTLRFWRLARRPIARA